MHMPELRACYDEGLALNGDLRGRVALRWTIHEGGGVESVEVVDSELADPCVAQCMVDEVESWEFERFGHTTVVTYPFNFVPWGDEDIDPTSPDE
jgi:hypothetical protein